MIVFDWAGAQDWMLVVVHVTFVEKGMVCGVEH